MNVSVVRDPDTHVPGPPGFPLHFGDAAAHRSGGVTSYRAHADPDGSGLIESVVVVAPGEAGTTALAPDRDGLLFVMAGDGMLSVGGARHPLHEGRGAHVTDVTEFGLENSGQGPLLVVVVEGPRAAGAASTGPCRLTESAATPAQDAVSGREFRVLFDAGSGCSGMTQFLGYVPHIRTPRHIHPYSEMICVVAGSGVVEIAGRTARVGVGSCYYLPKGVPHLVENTGEGHLIELGVFTPALSPVQNTPVE